MVNEAQGKTKERSAGPSSGGAAGPDGKGRAVLIVDDEPSICRLFLLIIETAFPGLRLDVASNGSVAVEQFRVAHHDIVIMDLHMPVMDGQAAFREIRSWCREQAVQMPSVVFCTGYAPPDTVREIITRDPRHGLLLKPVGGDTLVDVIRGRLSA